MSVRFDPRQQQALSGAKEALTRWTYDSVFACDAVDRLRRSWGLSAEEALALVKAERRNRGAQ